MIVVRIIRNIRNVSACLLPSIGDIDVNSRLDTTRTPTWCREKRSFHGPQKEPCHFMLFPLFYLLLKGISQSLFNFPGVHINNKSLGGGLKLWKLLWKTSDHLNSSRLSHQHPKKRLHKSSKIKGFAPRTSTRLKLFGCSFPRKENNANNARVPFRLSYQVPCCAGPPGFM